MKERIAVITWLFFLTCVSNVLAATRRQVFIQHKDTIQEARCSTCHDTSVRLEILTHNAVWVDVHKSVAVNRSAECEKCHSRTYCAECHSFKQSLKPSEKNPEDVESTFPHRGNWISRHFVEAKVEPDRCYRCHTQSYCYDCHVDKSYAPGSSSLPRNPHPSAWNHGTEARRNIVKCVSCHERGAATDCIECHRAGGIGGNPHPPGWVEKHPGLDRETDRPCIFCHGR